MNWSGMNSGVKESKETYKAVEFEPGEYPKPGDSVLLFQKPPNDMSIATVDELSESKAMGKSVVIYGNHYPMSDIRKLVRNYYERRKLKYFKP